MLKDPGGQVGPGGPRDLEFQRSQRNWSLIGPRGPVVPMISGVLGPGTWSHFAIMPHFYITFLWNIAQNLLEEPGCSWSSIFSGCNKNPIPLHTYFVFERIGLFETICFCELFCSYNCLLKPEIFSCCWKTFQFQKVVISCKICHKIVQLKWIRCNWMYSQCFVFWKIRDCK